MKKNLVIIFFIIVLGLMFFSADFCLALEKPRNLEVSSIGQASSTLKWEWSEGDGTLKQFKVLDKSMGSTTWIERYPIAGVGTITYNLMGLSGGNTYNWRVKAEAKDSDNDSLYVDGPEFTTIIKAPSPPSPKGNDDVILGIMNLENPLAQDTLWGAIDAVLNFLILASFAIVPVIIIYAGFLMIFAAGDETKIKRGKDIIFWTVIAVAIILFAKGLPAIVKGVFAS